MATAGVTHDVTLGGVGYMLAQVKNGVNYVRDTLPGYVMPSAAISTGGTESLDSPDGFNFGALPVRRVFFDEWRGLGRSFFRGGASGKPTLAGPREESSLDLVNTGGGPGGLVADLVAMRPLMAGAGIGAVPYETDMVTGVAASDFASIFYKGNLYVVQGTNIYTASVGGTGNFTGLTATGGAVGAGPKSCGFSADGTAWVCFGTTPRQIDNPAVSYAVAGPVDFMLAYKGVTLRAYTAPNSYGILNIDRNAVNIHSCGFTAPIRGMCVHEGSVWVGTDDGLYRLTGELKASNPTTAPNTLDQFAYNVQLVVPHQAGGHVTLGLKNWRGLISFDGSLWGALDGRVVRIAVTGGGFNFEVQQQPIPSGWVWSTCVAAGQLFVVIQSTSVDTIKTQLWAFDPGVNGWYYMSTTLSNHTYIFTGGALVRNGQLMACHDSQALVTVWPFDATNPSGLHITNYQAAGSEGWHNNSARVIFPMITPEDLANLSGGKLGLVRVLKAGVEWDTTNNVSGWRGWPDLTAAVGTLRFSLFYSKDLGKTWVTMNNAMGTQYYYPDSSNVWVGRTDWLMPAGVQVIKPVSQIGQGAPAQSDQNFNGWMLRLNVDGQPSPLLRRFFVDYQVLEFNSQIGNRWKLALDLSFSPEALRLDGQPADVPTPVNYFGNIYTEGDALALNLITAWSTGATLDFGDINGQAGHSVKIVSYKIERAAPGRFPALASNGGTLQQNYIMWVELVEVVE